MTFSDAKQIDEALTRLGKQMVYHFIEPVSFVVCGGGALSALNIATRTTLDVDVLIMVSESKEGVTFDYNAELPGNIYLAENIQT